MNWRPRNLIIILIALKRFGRLRQTGGTMSPFSLGAGSRNWRSCSTSPVVISAPPLTGTQPVGAQRAVHHNRVPYQLYDSDVAYQYLV